MLLFLAMGTQWRWAGMGHRVGLDYSMIEVTAKMTGIEVEPREPLFVQLREMEQAALEVWAEQARKAGSGGR